MNIPTTTMSMITLVTILFSAESVPEYEVSPVEGIEEKEEERREAEEEPVHLCILVHPGVPLLQLFLPRDCLDLQNCGTYMHSRVINPNFCQAQLKLQLHLN